MSTDVLVIGAGVGGLCAAARLAREGHKPLVVESRDRVGGRASSIERDGFTINTGAIAIEYGGVLEETFKAVGAPFEIRIPQPATKFRIGGRELEISKGPLGKLVNGALKRGASLLQSDDVRTSVEDWLSGYTRNETVHAIFRNLCAAIFAVNADELPVKAFMTYFLTKGAFRDFGFSPTGTLSLMQGLADAIVRDGGQVQLGATVDALHVEEGSVAAALVNGTEIRPRLVVSNAGPLATVELAGRDHFDDAYLERLDRDLKPSANIVVNVASGEPLFDAPGIITFGTTRRLCNMANLTATCPELAPPGRHLYVAYGVPKPAVGDFDEQAEVEATLEDLRDEFHSFDQRTEILSIEVMRGAWPAQRSVAGFDLPRETPIANLFNVGDGVRTYGNGGVQACAETAKLVVEQLTSPPTRVAA